MDHRYVEMPSKEKRSYQFYHSFKAKYFHNCFED